MTAIYQKYSVSKTHEAKVKGLMVLKTKTVKLVLCAVFTAIICVLSQIIIPISVVPVSLSTFAIMICGGVLGAKIGLISTALYILIGAVGIPVFAGLKGGIAVLFGPTGGFIFGYLIIAFASGITFNKNLNFISGFSLLILSVLVCCAIGAIWYVFITKSGFFAAVLTCVLPFLPGEIVKILIAYPVIVRIKKQI